MPGTHRFLASVFSCLIGGLLMALVLPSVAFAAPPSGYQFGKSQALDQASVSVVRLVVSYTPATCPPATGLGVIVASSPSAASLTDWVLTAGSLLSPAASPTSCGKKPLLSQIRILASSAYTTDTLNNSLAHLSCATLSCGGNTSGPSILCQPSLSPPCASGAVLVPFTTPLSLPLPYIDPVSSLSGQTAFGIGLTAGAGFSATPQPFATPASVPIPVTNLTPTAITHASIGEPGMPFVNTLGQLTGMQIGRNDDGSVVSFVNQELPTLQTGQNLVHDDWGLAVPDYYHGSLNKARDILQSMKSLNAKFQAPSTLLQLITAHPAATSTTTPAGTTASANQAGPFGLPTSKLLPFVAIAALVVLVLVLLTITFVLWRRRAKGLREFKEIERRAEKRANQDVPRIRQEELAQAQPPAQEQQGWEQWRQQNALINGQPPAPAAPPASVQPQSPVPLSPPAPVSQQSPSWRCPSCGAPVKPTDIFCSQCRTQLAPSESGLHLRPVNPPAAPASSAEVANMPTVEMSPSQMQEVLGQPQPGADAERTQPFPKQPLVPAPRHGRFVVATRSDRGYKRKYKPNEDSLFAVVGAQSQASAFQDLGLFVVADGMGGHANGKDASNLAIQTIEERVIPELKSTAPMREEDYIQLLINGVQSANLAVHQRNMEQHADMGTTMTAALIVDTTAYVANVGDSRTYLYRKSEGLKKITNDHSVVASLVTAGIINADDVYTHPKRNQIYRSLGEKPTVEVDIFSVALQPGDILLLCCDGLWEMTRDHVIQDILLTMPDLSQVGQALIQAALDGGGDDNISVVLVKVDDVTPPAAAAKDFEILATPAEPQYPRTGNEPPD